MPKSTQECIRELHMRGHSQRDIAKTLHISRNTVSKYLAEDLSPRPPLRPMHTSPTMAPHASTVVSWLEADLLLPRKQRHTCELPKKLRVNRCLADCRASEVILPDGRVAKCEHFDEEEFIGDIYSPWRDEALLASWAKRATPRAGCADCPFFPQCVPLERCAWDKVGCDDAFRAMRRHKYENRILAEFKRYKGDTA